MAAHGHFHWNEILARDHERAKLMKPIFNVPHVGRIAILTEPGGAGGGWITPWE